MSDCIDHTQRITEQLMALKIASIRHVVRSNTLSCRLCQTCGQAIPAARRTAVKGVRLCIDCQRITEFSAKFCKRSSI